MNELLGAHMESWFNCLNYNRISRRDFDIVLDKLFCLKNIQKSLLEVDRFGLYELFSMSAYKDKMLKFSFCWFLFDCSGPV